MVYSAPMSFFKFPKKTSPSQARTAKPDTNNDSVVFDDDHDHDHHDHHDVSSSDSYDDGGGGDGGDSD